MGLDGREGGEFFSKEAIDKRTGEEVNTSHGREAERKRDLMEEG
jgi:hypothetical protein